jgi:hypothetical protein
MRAKGSSYVVAAALSGGSLTLPSTVPVRLPENLDNMFEMDAHLEANPVSDLTVQNALDE